MHDLYTEILFTRYISLLFQIYSNLLLQFNTNYIHMTIKDDQS